MRLSGVSVQSCPVCGDGLISVEETHGNRVYVCPTKHGRFVLPKVGRIRPETHAEWIRSLLGSRLSSGEQSDDSY